MCKKLMIFLKYALLCAAMIVVGFGTAAKIYSCDKMARQASSFADGTKEYTAEQFRTERQQLRAMQKAQLNEIIYSAQGDSEMIARAQRQLLELLEREETENLLEGLLEMRGFYGAVVSVGRDSASVLVQTELLTRQQSSMILDLVCRESGILSGNIKIIPIK